MAEVKSNKNNSQIDKGNKDEQEKSIDKKDNKKNPIREEDISIKFENGENN